MSMEEYIIENDHKVMRIYRSEDQLMFVIGTDYATAWAKMPLEKIKNLISYLETTIPREEE